jgi:hypothetical protein
MYMNHSNSPSAWYPWSVLHKHFVASGIRLFIIIYSAYNLGWYYRDRSKVVGFRGEFVYSRDSSELRDSSGFRDSTGCRDSTGLKLGADADLLGTVAYLRF